MTLKKSRIKETEILLSFSALDRPDIMINLSVGSILLQSSTENRFHVSTPRYLATFLPRSVSFSPFPTTLGNRLLYLHFISDFEKIPQPARIPTLGRLTPKPTLLFLLCILEGNAQCKLNRERKRPDEVVQV